IYMTLSEIADEFYEFLSSDDITELEKNGGTFNTPALNLGMSSLILPGNEYDNLYTLQSIQQQYTETNGIRVFKCTWKSKKKVGRVTAID
ncbi:hypothetical protein LAJ59_18740, partial [Streptococcus pneumoniae]|nr:hypothetical protein [Streptococcus pneumoniae]